jgi:hypothetical protein
VNLLDISDRITCQKYKQVSENQSNHILFDIRSSNEFNICSLPNSTSIISFQNNDSFFICHFFVQTLVLMI